MLETLNSYVPVIIRRRLAQNPQPLQAPEYQAFEAAVLFADISGFTALAERLARRGPQGVEQISNLLNEYFGWWIDLVTAYGGDVLKFAGDALLAAWPADEASGGLQAACLRAGSCILKARSVLRNEQKFQQSSLPEGARLTSRAGLAAGRVYLAHLGGAFGRWEVLVSGEPLTQASLAMQSVAPGEIGLAPNIEHILGSASQTALSNTGIPTLVGLEAGFATPGTDPAELFQAPEIAVGALQAYIPGAIKERLKAGQTGWLAELRTVSALFINLPGLGHGLALEKAQEIMQEVQSALYYYEGSLNKFSVDEKGTTMLAAFGLPPMAHEDDALRAGLAALEIERRLTALDVRCSIGICSGQAFCGSIGNLRRREYTLIGTAINLASRLMQAARVTNHPILVDRSTYERSYERLDFDELPPVMVKGKSEAVPVYTPRSERRFQIRRGVTMIGRQPERQRLLAGLEGLAAASGLQIGERVFIIEGEPGIGKSRLLEDLLEQAGMQGVPCLNSGGDAIEKATPYYAWRSIFAQLMGLDFAMPAAERQAQLAAALPADLSEQAPLLNEILQVDFSANDLTANLEGQVRAENTRLLLVTLLRRLVEARPHLIVIDDIHWLDTASWALSLDVARLAAEAPLMLAFTSRPLSDPAPLEYGLIQRLPQTVTLPLLRLEGEQALELVLQRLGVNDLPRPVKSLILEKAEGHPFFSEELAYALRDTGVLLIENGASRLAPGYDDLDALNLPNSVQGVITSRIDRLSPTQQLSLKVASVIGRVFSYLALNAIYPIDQERPQLRASLVALEKLDITPLETPDPDLKYIFKHSITREVAYNLMLFAQRRQLHQAIGEWYEQTFAIDLEPHYPLLAHHYHLAENAPKAVDYLEKAGQQALLSGAYLEAADFYAEALRVAERSAGELALAPERRASWHRQLGEACLGLGDLGRSRENLEAAARLLGWPSPPEKGKLLGRLLLQAGRQITRLLRGSHTRLSSRRENLLEAARTHERLTEIYYFLQDRPRMLNSSLHALNLSEKAGPSPELARAYANMCVVAGVVRAHGLARRYERRTLEVAGQMEHLPSRARVFSRSGMYNLGCGRYEQAVPLLEKASEIAERLHDYRQWGESSALLAYIDYLVARFEASRARFARVYQMAAQVGNAQFQNWGQWGQAQALLRLGRVDEARSALDAACLRLESGPDRGTEAITYGLLGLVHLRQGNWREAVAYACRLACVEQMERFSLADFEGHASAAEVFLTLLESGQDMRVELAPEERRKATERACQSAAHYGRVYAIGQPRAHLLAGRLKRLDGQLKEALDGWQKGLRLAEALKMPYEQARLHAALASVLPEGAGQGHREAARRLFEQLNALPDLAALEQAAE